MLHSQQEKRKIILDNYNHPSKQIKLEELKKNSDDWQVPSASFRSLEEGCGDILHLLLIKTDKLIKKCQFSAQQSCLITIAAANILCSCLENKEIKFAREIINNCQNMAEGKKYNLDNCPDLQVFNDIFNFPHRVECLKVVIRGIEAMLKK